MRFKGSISQLFVLIAGIGVAAAESLKPVMQAGAWQMRMTTVMRNPKGESQTGPEAGMKMCLSEEFLATDPYLTPGLDKQRMEQKKAKCTTSDHQREGNSASWKITCTMADGSNVDMTVKTVASRHKLTSDMQQTIKKSDETILGSVAMEMSFIGECTSDMPKM